MWTPACSVDASLGRQPRLPPVEGRQEVGTSGLHSEGSVACPLMSLPCCPWVPGGSAPHTRQRPQQGASAAGAAFSVNTGGRKALRSKLPRFTSFVDVRSHLLHLMSQHTCS